MKKLLINIKEQKQVSYPIFIGEDILFKITSLCDLSKYSKIAVVTDKVVEKLLLKNSRQFLPENSFIIVLPYGERAKNIDCVEEIWRELFENGCDRKSIVINIGGGVITDIGGFAASTYMRGIPFINAPTTLLSQVDASIGGKTGINFNEIKNLVGTFDQPKAIIIDTSVLKTLPEREFVSGFGEIIKHGLISDKNYFEYVTSKKPYEFTQEELVGIIEKSCELKGSFVGEDEKEGELRKTINFGHTIGHALESLSFETDKPLTHGEAISIGMVAESYISVFTNLLKENEIGIIKNGFVHAGLPISYKNIDEKRVLEKIKGDKKNERGLTNFTLLRGIGKSLINQKVSSKIILDALKKINEL